MFDWIKAIGIGACLFFIGQLIVGNNNKLRLLEQIVIYPIVGFVSYTLGLYIFSLLHIRPWLPFIAFVLVVIQFAQNRPRLISFPRLIQKIQPHWLIIFTILAGVISQLYIVALNGLPSASGYHFYGANAHDGLWHAALMQILTSTFPPFIPSYAPEILRGYHYFVDLFGSEIIRLSDLSVFTILFRLFPILFSLHLGLASLALAKRLTEDVFAQFITVFLVYFSGSLGFIILLFKFATGSGETIFWAQQSLTTFINLPLGVSFSVLLTLLLLLFIGLKKKQDIRLWFVAALLIGCQIAIKSYGGVLMLFAFTIITFTYSLLRKKLIYLAPWLFAVVIAGLLSWLTIDKTMNLFVFSPGEMLKLMMESPDRLNLPRWESFHQTFQNSSNIVGLFVLWLGAGVIFIIGNFSIRLIGIFSVKHIWQKSPLLTLFIGIISATGIILPILYLQKGTGWNTIQFMYYSLFLLNFLTGFFVSTINRARKILLVIFFVTISLASSIPVLDFYRSIYAESKDTMIVSIKESQALNTLKSLPPNTIVLSGYSDTAYITAFSGKQTYFSDSMQADVLLYPTEERGLELSRLFVWCKHPSEIQAFMKDHDISIIYVNKTKYPNCINVFDQLDFVKLLYANDEVDLFQRNF